MNEEIEYAEMLEIPVSTVNVVHKTNKRKKRKAEVQPRDARPAFSPENPNLKEKVIARVNDKLDSEPDQISAEAALFAESANSAGRLDFDANDSIDTVRLYSADDVLRDFDREESEENFENGAGRYALNNENHTPKGVRIALGVEFAAMCALCGAIFLTNVFMPGSAINTFFRALSTTEQTATDNRKYNDFTLSAVVSDLSDTELTLSETGVLSFTDECCVYPAADGKVMEVVQTENGGYRVKLSHSDTFTGIIDGLSHVYYAVGDEVKANVPVGYSTGEDEVQVTMYSEGALLNCFQLTEENCLAWIAQE